MKSFESKDPLTNYVLEHSMRYTPEQYGLQEATLNHPLCGMLGAPEVLQLNTNLMQLIGAKKILDVGVYTGASSLAAAIAIPEDGKVIGLDMSQEYYNIGKPFIEASGVSHKIQFRWGQALESLQALMQENQANTFDFAFIDCDKPNVINYYEMCLQLVRSGGVIAIDNTVWSGNVINPDDQSESTKAIRALNSKLKDDQRINLSYLNIADGLTLCFKK